MEEENTAVLYLYSKSSSAIQLLLCTPNKFTGLKQYLPSFKPPLKNGDVVYRQVYIGTNSEYKDWNTNFLEWTKDSGHGLFIKYVRDERITPVGCLLYAHKMLNSHLNQTTLSKECGVLIAARFRKISDQKSRERSGTPRVFKEQSREGEGISTPPLLKKY